MIAECDKMTFTEAYNHIKKLIAEHNLTYCNYDSSEYKLPKVRVVFDPFKSEWVKYQQKFENGKMVDDLTKPITYSPESCTYELSMASKYWFSETIGNGLFGHSLDPNDPDHFGLRMNDYISEWTISYCYLVP